MTDNDTIQQLFNDKAIIATPIVGKGDVNRVYIVKQDNNQIVVRLNSEDELNRFKREASCLEEASNKGIPSPHLIDKLRWAIDRKQDKIEEFSQRVRVLVEI